MSGEFFLVVFIGEYGESIAYCGDSEIEAYKKYREKSKIYKPKLVRANVKRKLILGTPFIMSYDIIEVIKES
ncbi:hypothetical protein ACV3Q2_02235 [Clostridium perfringens]|uniref:hypothetical protein n=1 Tax=Clostridium perfringens TaxID=1502 RepID=UPI001C853182|nr:hypothetical protein [Clostridium perfringens]